MNVVEEGNAWAKVENIYLCQELAVIKREAKIMVHKYDMLCRENVKCLHSWIELMVEQNELTVKKEVIVRQAKEIKKKLKCNFCNTHCSMHRNKERPLTP